MKKSIYILFCLFMSLLLINTSQVNAQIPSIKHCEQLEPTAARPACEAAALGQSPIQGESPISAETVSPPDQSDDPRNIMNSESVDFNKETLQLHKRIAELENLLTEANTKVSDLEGKLANAVSPTVYDDAVRLYKEQQAQLTEANTKISDLESEVRFHVDLVRSTSQEASKQLTEANTKISDLEDKIEKICKTGQC